jgi:phage terminase large subunit-like protein
MTDEEWAEVAGRLLTVRFPAARPAQQTPPGDWKVWLILSGRGWGKTRTGAEETVERAHTEPGDYFVCAPTYRDMRLVCVEGSRSGLLAVLRRRCIDFEWSLTKSTITLANGSQLICGGADEPDRGRGYNFSGGWADELASWRRPDAWSQIRFGTRLGRAQIVATTTPRPTDLIRDLVADPTVHITRGSTFDNAANLSPEAIAELERKYGGTRAGRQELEGELLTDVPGALWTLEMIDAARHHGPLPDFDRVVVGVDPAVTSGEDSDLTGVVAVGKAGDEFWVLADRSGRYTPDGTARVAIDLLDELGGDRIVGEVNNGGDYIGTVLRHADRDVPYSTVHASRGKHTRAEPVAGLYEQGRAHHVEAFVDLEDELCTWTVDSRKSPDRMDALVWAFTDLMEGRRRPRVAEDFYLKGAA